MYKIIKKTIKAIMNNNNNRFNNKYKQKKKKIQIKCNF